MIRKTLNAARLTIVAMLSMVQPMQATADNTSAAVTFETKLFRTPPMDYRPIPLWFWNNTTINASTLEEQLEQMVNTDGYGGCAILPFGTNFRPSYLSTDYFALYARAIEKARQLGAHMSIYDEYGFPSGSMGAINGSGVKTFMNNHPDYTVKRLDKIEYRIDRGATFNRLLTYTGKLMSVVAWNSESKQIINLRSNLNEDTKRLTWTAPDETGWHIMVCQCITDGDPNVDYLSPEAVKLFIQDTHEAYFKQYSNDFGKTIVSTFFDEPTMYRAQGRMWTSDFNEQFERRYGFSPEELYPALWYNIGERTPWVRNLLFGLHSALYSEGFMKTISDWASAHGILATGHQDQEEIANPTSVAGDLMLVGKYLSMPGIDKIGGGRPTENFYKVVSSSANCWDKTYVMSETYGDMGNLPVEELYHIAIEQYTKGINHLIPHAVWYNNGDVTFLPELSWRNPLYKAELPRFNSFLARLNYLLARPSRHVADVAMVYPIQTLYAGHYLDGPKGFYQGGVNVEGTDYPEISHLLTDELGFDFTYLHPEVIDDRCEVSNGQLNMINPINTEHFKVIIVPGMSTISSSNLQKIEEAWKQGVGVIFTTQLPKRCADSKGSDTSIAETINRMLNGEGQHTPALFVPTPTAESMKTALDTLLPQPDVQFTSGKHPFNYLHKVVDGHHVYYFGNIDTSSAECTIRLKDVSPSASMTLLNPHNGADQPALLTASGDNAMLTITLRPNQSIFLVDDALLNKNATGEIAIEQHSSYTIEARVNIHQLSAGICFASTDAQNFYMWQVNVADPAHPLLRPHRWTGGNPSLLAEIPIPSEANIGVEKPFNIRIEVEDEKYACTYINNILIDERNGQFQYANMGFRQSHDGTLGKTEKASFDNVRITKKEADSNTPQVILDEDFSQENPFTSGILSDGWLRIDGQMTYDELVWLKTTPQIDPIPQTDEWVNPMVLPGLDDRSLGDPYIMKYKGYYYLYVSAGDRNIYCWRSKDLVNWSSSYICCTDETTAVAYAPEVIYWNGKFYMCTSPRGGGHYMLTSDSPLGPFVHQTGNMGRDIDGSMFIDDNGSWYFYHANNGGIRGCTMPTHLSYGDDVDLGCCMTGQWTEGPCVFKRNGLYYLLYTGNHVWTNGYRIDYAISNSSPLSGFRPQSDQNPILIDTETPTHKALGHGTAFVGPDLDTYYFCYHNLQDNKARRLLNFERIGWCGDKLMMTGPTNWEQDKPIVAANDYFERQELGKDWTILSGDQWKIANSDHLTQTATEGQQSIIFNKGAYEQYTAEFTLRSSTATGSFGAIFSYQDAENYGEALINAAEKKLEVNFYVNGSTLLDKTIALPADFDPACWHAIRIEKNERFTYIYVDGMKKCQIIRKTNGGQIGYITHGAAADFSYTAISPYVDGSGIRDYSLPVPGLMAASMCKEKSADVVLTSYGMTVGTSNYLKSATGSKISYHVNIQKDNIYNLGLRYNASATARIRLLLDGKAIANDIELPATNSVVTTMPIYNLSMKGGRHTFSIEVLDGAPSFYEYTFKPGVAHPHVMADNFDNGFSNEWGYREGNWTIQNGQLESTSRYGKMLMGGFDDIHLTDYTVECDVIYTSNDMNGGLLFRTTNASTGGADDNPVLGSDFLQGYIFMAGATSVALGKHNYGWQTLATVNKSISPSVPHHMKVEVEGATIRCYIDDMETPIITYTDPKPYITGRAGFRTHNTVMRFDNFQVTPKEYGASGIRFPQASTHQHTDTSGHCYNLLGQVVNPSANLHGVFLKGQKKVLLK